MGVDAAGDDAVEVFQIGVHVDGDAVERDAAGNAYAHGGDFIFSDNAIAHIAFTPMPTRASRRSPLMPRLPSYR